MQLWRYNNSFETKPRNGTSETTKKMKNAIFVFFLFVLVFNDYYLLITTFKTEF